MQRGGILLYCAALHCAVHASQSFVDGESTFFYWGVSLSISISLLSRRKIREGVAKHSPHHLEGDDSNDTTL